MTKALARRIKGTPALKTQQARNLLEALARYGYLSFHGTLLATMGSLGRTLRWDLNEKYIEVLPHAVSRAPAARVRSLARKAEAALNRAYPAWRAKAGYELLQVASLLLRGEAVSASAPATRRSSTPPRSSSKRSSSSASRASLPRRAAKRSRKAA